VTGELIRYDAMCRAIVEAHRVDEVKDIRDRAAALELYARQAQNEEAERRCREIRERAERRWGELYAGSAKAQGTRGLGAHAERVPNDARSLAEMGVSFRDSVNWQARAAIPREQFEATLAAGKSTDVLLKQQRRERREIELGEQTIAAATTLGTKLYNVIYADPPWCFEPYSRETGMDRAADNHYPTLSIDEITALDVPAAKDCLLFLWATAPMLPQALNVIKAWGFDYKTHCIWVKDHIGTGYWYRNLHELLLLATRGQVPAPPADQRLPSVFHEPSGRHSEKPACFAELIATWFPHLPKLEMFARQKRAGWDCWGNEVESNREDEE
jgi:N6-adenosine-specific RNA methylase IME4